MLLWQSLLERYGYDDMRVIPCMLVGVKLTGEPDPLPCYPARLKTEDRETSSVKLRRLTLSI